MELIENCELYPLPNDDPCDIARILWKMLWLQKSTIEESFGGFPLSSCNVYLIDEGSFLFHREVWERLRLVLNGEVGNFKKAIGEGLLPQCFYWKSEQHFFVIHLVRSTYFYRSQSVLFFQCWTTRVPERDMEAFWRTSELDADARFQSGYPLTSDDVLLEMLDPYVPIVID